MESKPAAKIVDADQFKIGMRSLAGAVSIITSTHASHRYGMTATAEVVVRERRLIDLALDPFRQIAG